MSQTGTNLIAEETKSKLLSLLDLHIKNSGFYEKITQKLDSLSGEENVNIEVMYKEIYAFMTSNMPEEVQDAFFEDLRRVLSKESE